MRKRQQRRNRAPRGHRCKELNEMELRQQKDVWSFSVLDAVFQLRACALWGKYIIHICVLAALTVLLLHSKCKYLMALQRHRNTPCIRVFLSKGSRWLFHLSFLELQTVVHHVGAFNIGQELPGADPSQGVVPAFSFKPTVPQPRYQMDHLHLVCYSALLKICFILG